MRYTKCEENTKNKIANPKWFDKECQIEKQMLRSLGKEICNDPKNYELRQRLVINKRRFKKLCKKKKIQSVESNLKHFNTKNIKELKGLKQIFHLSKKEAKQTCDVDIEESFLHFKNINTGPASSMTDRQETNTPTESDKLNRYITVQEVKEETDKLKFRKAAGHDKIPNEIFKVGKLSLIRPLTSLFNKILASGEFPHDWRIGLITPIYKKGDRSNIENYRGITLLCTLSKLFTSILNERLYEYLTINGILKKEQFGFRKNHSTVDCIFILKSLVDRYVKSKPKTKQNKLFTCFVDFKRAFDSIPREKLFQKI